MKMILKTINLDLVAILLTSCGGEKTTDYTVWLEGDWALKNAGELERILPDRRSYLLVGAQISFAGDGTLTSTMMQLDKKTEIKQTGTWEMPTTGEKITIKSNNGPFDDELKIDFPDERTFFIRSNQLFYHFVKL
jgi:hypothetical protein